MQPATAEGTFDRILREKKIRVAIDVANPPFGILDKDNQPDGSDVATARALAKDLGVTTFKTYLKGKTVLSLGNQRLIVAGDDESDDLRRVRKALDALAD